jgi:hypothetical protein
MIVIGDGHDQALVMEHGSQPCRYLRVGQLCGPRGLIFGFPGRPFR